MPLEVPGSPRALLSFTLLSRRAADATCLLQFSILLLKSSWRDASRDLALNYDSLTLDAKTSLFVSGAGPNWQCLQLQGCPVIPGMEEVKEGECELEASLGNFESRDKGREGKKE